MKIGGVRKRDPINYSGKLACTIFLPGCNFACGFCHNPELAKGEIVQEGQTEEDILYFLEHHTYVDGVVITGGEPTLQAGLPTLLKKIRKLPRGNLSIKLDTNGSHFEILQDLKREKLVDYVAMDVKAPPSLYSRVIGTEIDLRDDIEKGMALTAQFREKDRGKDILNYEFRTTVVPIDRENGDFSFMKVEELADIAKWIADSTGSNVHPYYIQPFVPPKREKLLDSRFEAFGETPAGLLEEMKKAASKYLPECKIRK